MNDINLKRLNDFNNNELYKTYILNTIKDVCPCKKKTKYLNEYYLDKIIYMLNDLCRWKSLSLICSGRSEYHWKTIENKFRQWSKLNVFEIKKKLDTSREFNLLFLK